MTDRERVLSHMAWQRRLWDERRRLGSRARRNLTLSSIAAAGLIAAGLSRAVGLL